MSGQLSACAFRSIGPTEFCQDDVWVQCTRMKRAQTGAAYCEHIPQLPERVMRRCLRDSNVSQNEARARQSEGRVTPGVHASARVGECKFIQNEPLTRLSSPPPPLDPLGPQACPKGQREPCVRTLSKQNCDAAFKKRLLRICCNAFSFTACAHQHYRLFAQVPAK